MNVSETPPDQAPPTPKDPSLLRVRIGCGGAALFLSLLIALLLFLFRETPDEIEPEEPRTSVRVQTVHPESAQVTLESHGTIRPLQTVQLTPEIPGKIVQMPRTLQVGESVREGELLLRIDPRDSQSALDEAEAALERAQANREQLQEQQRTDQMRHELAQRAEALAQREFERAQRLYQEEDIGSVSTVEAAELAWVRAANEAALLDQSLSLLPARKREADAAIRSAQATLQRARNQLDRTEITAPFSGRLTTVDVRQGQSVQPGQPLLTLADDHSLEILFPLQAADLRQWVPFDSPSPDPQLSAWFPPLPDLPVTLSWAEGSQELHWTARLHRVVSFDTSTRTAMLAARVSAEAARHPDSPLPLADGMFCRVSFPGHRLENIYRLPRAAVTFDQNAYLADEDDRLRTVEVRVAKAQDDHILVDRGLSPGDRVIVTRLIAPLEGARLEILED